MAVVSGALRCRKESSWSNVLTREPCHGYRRGGAIYRKAMYNHYRGYGGKREQDILLVAGFVHVA